MKIVKGQVNEVVVTLYEKTTLSPVYYLFAFYNKSTRQYAYCLPQEDTSDYPTRYNRFEIEDKETPNPLNGEVNLAVGEYDYTIYEQSSNSNLDTTGLSIVEGPQRLVVTDTAPTVNAYTGPYTNSEYDPG